MATKNTPICRYGLTIKGTRNKRHQCNERCQWTGTEALEHLRTASRAGFPAPVQIHYAPCPCGRPYVDHWNTVASDKGFIAGLRAGNVTDACNGHIFTKLHMLGCLCPDCETYVEDRRLAEIAANIRRQKVEVAA